MSTRAMSLRALASFALSALFLLVPATRARAQAESAPAAWSDKTIALAASLPVQDGGRVKPLNTFAGFTLLRINGKRSIRLEDGRKLGPTEWLLDTLLRPLETSEYPIFLVQNDAVIEAIGVDTEGKKARDRYSFSELRPGLQRLFELAREYASVEEKERSSVQQQVVLLAGNVDLFMGLAGFLDFARYPLEVPATGTVRELVGRDRASFSDVVANAPALVGLFRSSTASETDREAASRLLQAASELSRTASLLALVPPVVGVEEEPEWMAPGDFFESAVGGVPLADEHRAALVRLEGLGAQLDDANAFEAELAALHTALVGLAAERDEYGTIGLELGYYKADLVSRSLYLFVLAFLASAFLWLKPRNRFLYGTTSALVAVGTLLLVTAIVIRCTIQGRPPVTTLYETVLFVTGVGLIVALFIEWVGRRRVSVSTAAFLGMVGLFIANGYEVLDKKDTMPSLVAVLDTNFWLATHVTAITVGYSAGMLAALLGSVYLLAKAVRFRGGTAGDRTFYSSLGRMVYGVLCFGLIFSVVGTILGGVWANESWGRFWGWDPKENGALLIVITQIAILHGRMGGYLREHGVCMAAAFGGTVVAFSWWGVNLLGVGLHSYGFTSGIHSALWSYYGIQWAIVAVGGVAWLLERRTLSARTAAAALDA